MLEVAYHLGGGDGSGLVDCYMPMNVLGGRDMSAKSRTEDPFNHLAFWFGRDLFDAVGGPVMQIAGDEPKMVRYAFVGQ